MIQLIPTPKRAEFSRPLKYVEIPARIHSADPAHARLLAAFCDYALRLHNVPFEIAEGGIEVTAEAFDKPDAYRLTLGRTSVVSVSGLSGLSHARQPAAAAGLPPRNLPSAGGERSRLAGGLLPRPDG